MALILLVLKSHEFGLMQATQSYIPSRPEQLKQQGFTAFIDLMIPVPVLFFGFKGVIFAYEDRMSRSFLLIDATDHSAKTKGNKHVTPLLVSF